jgi:rhodanese-related sulfurtransferase
MSMNKEEVFMEMKEEDVVVLNVLPEADFEKLRIKNSFNVPLGDDSQAFVKAVEDNFGRDKFFITYCANLNCPKGPQAARILKEYGFDADDFPGGVQSWMESGYPVEGSMSEEAAVLD